MSGWDRFWAAFKDELLQTIQIGNIGEEINRAIQPQPLFDLRLGGLTLSITDAVVATWAAMLLITALAIWLGRKPQNIPTTRRQLLAERLVSLLLDLCKSANMTYEQAEIVVPYIGTIGLFITLSNLLSVFKIPPPAKNPAFPIALALITIFFVVAISVRFVGWKGFLHSLVYPKPLLLPFKLLDYLIKPMSLSLRLFGNIFGAFILMEFVYLVMPAILPGIIGIWFDLADGILQGVIFTYLSATYIGEVIESNHILDAHPEPHQPAPQPSLHH